MAQLIEDQDQLKHEVEELTVRLSGKEAEIAILCLLHNMRDLVLQWYKLWRERM